MRERVRLQFATGFVQVDDGGDGPTRTTFVAMGNITDRNEALAAASSVLAQLVGPRRTVIADVADGPWARAGDELTLELPDGSTEVEYVRSREVQIDDDTGVARVTYQLADAPDLFSERLAVGLKRVGPGTVSGRAAASQPSNAVGTGLPSGPIDKVSPPPWSFSPPKVGFGPTWTNDGDDLTLVSVVAVSAPAISGGNSATVRVHIDGTLVRAFVVPGAFFGWTALCENTLIAAGSRVAVEISAYDGTADTTKLVVQLLVAPARLATKT